jgi:hypothetical protein
MFQEKNERFADPKEKAGSSFSEDIVWVDNGSNITVIAFTGLAIRFGGMPQFELKKYFRRMGVDIIKYMSEMFSGAFTSARHKEKTTAFSIIRKES